MSTTVRCPRRDSQAEPLFVGAFDNAITAQLWLEAEHCNQLASVGDDIIRVCADGGTPDEHLYRFDQAA